MSNHWTCASYLFTIINITANRHYPSLSIIQLQEPTIIKHTSAYLDITE